MELCGSACSISVQGSQATGLYLPQGDMDLVVHAPKLTSPIAILRLIERGLCRPKYRLLCDTSSLKLLSHATVPVLKLSTVLGDIAVDVSVNQTNGLQAAKLIADWVKGYPLLKPLVLLVKRYLENQKLNVVYEGGLGGYSVVNMVMAFLQYRTSKRLPTDSLSTAVIEFFRFYGMSFDYRKQGISVADGGIITKPAQHVRLGYDARYGDPDVQLYICDPLNHTNNTARSSFAMHSVVESFLEAFFMLEDMRDIGASQSSLDVLFGSSTRIDAWRAQWVSRWETLRRDHDTISLNDAEAFFTTAKTDSDGASSPGTLDGSGHSSTSSESSYYDAKEYQGQGHRVSGIKRLAMKRSDSTDSKRSRQN